MPFDSSDSSETKFAPVAVTAAKAAGTVLKPFHGPTRRFPIDYVVVDADAPDLPMSADALKAKGFIS